jgi:formylmethanofuran dehydrogenase subunit E
MGKGNLLFRDRGKQAFTFFNRATGEGIRIVLKKFDDEMDRDKRKQYLLNIDVERIFEFKEPKFNLPEKARIFNSIICEKCGEAAAEHRIRISEGKKVCLDCFEDFNRGW